MGTDNNQKLNVDNLEIITFGIDAVKPENLIPQSVKLANNTLVINGKLFPINGFQKIYLIGAGKASAFMAYEIEKIIGDKINDGILVTKYGYSVKCNRIKILEAGHPIPDANSLLAGEEIFNLVSNLTKNDLVINLISGGGSSLLEILPAEIDLSDLICINEILTKCGANIREINTIRKHLSLIKGGGLAKAAYPATIISLIISDVIGDPIDLIASGPTAIDSSTYEDVWNIITKYEIERRLPKNVTIYLNAGLEKEISGIVNPKHDSSNHVDNFIIANNSHALEAAKIKAEQLGYHAEIINKEIAGDVQNVADYISKFVCQIQQSNILIERPACLLFGGEPTIIVRGSGIGGRNQHLALLCLQQFGNPGYDYNIICCGTDGTDGPTDEAGGMASPQIYDNAIHLGLNIDEFLENNDSYNFLRQVGGLFRTGPTGTNVMDIISVLVQ
ncbi:MAG: glycerate kinase [bacterium]